MDLNQDLYQLLKQSFPEYIEPSDIESCVAQILVPNSEKNKSNEGIGGLLVIIRQDVSIDNADSELIYLRNFHAQSAYPIADREELLAVIDGVVHDELFWVMEYKLDDEDEIESWHGVHLLDKHDELNRESGIAYQILSWSGKFDKLVV